MYSLCDFEGGDFGLSAELEQSLWKRLLWNWRFGRGEGGGAREGNEEEENKFRGEMEPHAVRLCHKNLL